MNWKYRVFGLLLASEVPIDMLEPVETAAEAEVTIRRGVLTEPLEPTAERFWFEVPGEARFLIEHGSEITVDAEPETPSGLLAVYLLGSCMGAVLHQRRLFLLHGSCVTKDGKAILITGDSGAGKSTLAAEFLRNGWKLLTDDVALIRGIEDGAPMVQSSYPSQKLWQDAADRYHEGETLLPLFQEERREKFNVKVQDYLEGQARLTAVVRLIPTENDCEVAPVEGFAKVDQLLRNTYRLYMIAEADQQQHFQRCVTLSTQITMLAALRSRQENTAPEVYRRIVAAC